MSDFRSEGAFPVFNLFYVSYVDPQCSAVTTTQTLIEFEPNLISTTNHRGQAPLHLAIKKNAFDQVKVILDRSNRDGTFILSFLMFQKNFEKIKKKFKKISKISKNFKKNFKQQMHAITTVTHLYIMLLR